MTIQEKLEHLIRKMNENPTDLNGLEATYTFELTDKEEIFSIVFQNEEVTYHSEPLEEQDCLLKMNENNFDKLIDGNLNATSAFMMGKIKAKGDLTYALKLQNVLGNYR
ncbi:SCP2 sterol-binding domain-containing protein [Halalkalibacillus halophilus]|uniref:SCP2 sterol-binding domain-containing protein n=1 Tax=Halalkalibacillus halophilus TaxID=392827 RepID=UPI000418181A|nr:SCP2 sterol-binding domain-containing protein [Halalkalibacillus halophilus]